MPGAAPYRRARAATSNALRQGTPATGKQLPGTRRLYKSRQPLRLSPCNQPAEVRDLVVSAPLVVQRRVGTLVGLLDQAVRKHALDRTVQRARTEPRRLQPTVCSTRPESAAGDTAAPSNRPPTYLLSIQSIYDISVDDTISALAVDIKGHLTVPCIRGQPLCTTNHQRLAISGW